MSETESVGNQVKINFYTELIKQEVEQEQDSEDNDQDVSEDNFDF